MRWLIYFGTDQDKVRTELEIEVINVSICNGMKIKQCLKMLEAYRFLMSRFYSILILEYIDGIGCKL